MGGSRGGTWWCIAISIVAPFVAVWFSRPALRIEAHALENPPRGGYVEVTVDRLQPLPWTRVERNGGQVTRRYVLGWIGPRALLVEAEPVIPTTTSLRGELHALSDEPRTWVDQTPGLAGIAYDAILDVAEPDQRMHIAIGGGCFTLAMLVYWAHRGYRWLARRRPVRQKPPLGLTLDGALPRSDELVTAIMRRHGFGVYMAEMVLYATTVMALAGLCVVAVLDFPMTGESLARDVASFALGWLIASPVSGLPLFWFVRRRRGELRFAARHGEVVDGVVASATVYGTRSWLTLWSKLEANATDIEVVARIGASLRHYRTAVLGAPAWTAPGAPMRVLATVESRWAIVIAPDGVDMFAKLKAPWLRGARGGVEKIPTARSLKLSAHGTRAEPDA